MKSWLFLFLLLAAPLSASAEDPHKPIIYVDECPGMSGAPTTENAWIVLDDDTGRLRHATPQELLEMGMDPVVNRSAEGLRLRIHSDGSKSVNLEGRFQSAMVVREEGDTTVSACVDDPSSAAAFLTGSEEK